VKRIASRLGLAQAASGLVSGVFTPFFGAWLAWRGLTADQIAILLSAGLLLRGLAGPASGIIADARNDRRTVMLVLYWATVIGYGALNFTAAPLFIFLASVPATVAFGSATPLLESVSVRLSERYGFNYGRVRLWASVGFCRGKHPGRGLRLVVRYVDSGSLARRRRHAVRRHDPEPSRSTPRPCARRSLPAAARNLRRNARIAALGRIPDLSRGDELRPGQPCLLLQLWRLHWRALGYSGLLIGILWPLGVLAEIALFSQSLRVLRLIGPTRLLLYGGLGCAMRWTILAFDPPLPVVVFAQFLHGATFALAHLGAMYFILRAVPPRLAATAQSLYSSARRHRHGNRDLCFRPHLCRLRRTRLSSDVGDGRSGDGHGAAAGAALARRTHYLRRPRGPCRHSLEQSLDPSLVVQMDRVRRRHTRQARHGHDLAGNHHDEFGPRGKAHISYMQ